MKSADRYGHAMRTKSARDRHRTRELIGLHADQADHAVVPRLSDARGDALDRHLGVHFVKGVDLDRNVLAQDLAIGAIEGDCVETGH